MKEEERRQQQHRQQEKEEQEEDEEKYQSPAPVIDSPPLSSPSTVHSPPLSPACTVHSPPSTENPPPPTLHSPPVSPPRSPPPTKHSPPSTRHLPPPTMHSPPLSPLRSPPPNTNSPPFAGHPPLPTMHSPPPSPPESPPPTRHPPPPTRQPPPLTWHSPPRIVLSPPPVANHNDLKPQSSPPLDSPPNSDSVSSGHASPNHVSSLPEHRPPPVKSPSPATTTKVEPTVADGSTRGAEEGKVGSGGRRLRPNLSILKRAKRESMVKRALLGFRICGFVFCLVSFSVLAADRNQGWALDSFHRYKEFRYCMAVNVIGFVYSGLQISDLAYQLSTSKQRSQNLIRHYLDFATDQMLTYLLMSASTSAAVRVDDWLSNWGSDKFPLMAKASVSLSFLAFVALAFCSLISGYALCILKSM